MVYKVVLVSIFGSMVFSSDDGHHNHWGAEKDQTTHHHDYHTDREVRSPFPILDHKNTEPSSIVATRLPRKLDLSDMPVVISDGSVDSSPKVKRAIVVNTVVNNKTDIKCCNPKLKDLFPKSCSIS